MTGTIHGPRTTIAAYRAGAIKNGWCCDTCGRLFDLSGHRQPLPRFAGTLIHKAIRHRTIGAQLVGNGHSFVIRLPINGDTR